MEDVRAEAGPLMYFPGSQTMPTEGISGFYDQSASRVQEMLGRDGEALHARYASRIAQSGESLEQCLFYDLWLDRISEYVTGRGIPMQRFTARKGDVLIWHANLVHGGTSIVDRASTRRSVVAHFLTEDVAKYYDMNFFRHQSVLCLDDIDQRRPAVLQVRS
jgi:ectoine hydroxylase-related dioxygenase (phytanoyl-CoA dioxygenase family)